MNQKRTKIVATISDLKCDAEFLTELHEAGINVVRLNTAHQVPADAQKVIDEAKKVSDKLAIMVDTKGPEVRTGPNLEGAIEIKTGDVVKFKSNDLESPLSKDNLQVNYPGFVSEVEVGHHILIDDGEIEFIVEEKTADTLVTKATNDGKIKKNKSVNVPEASLKLASVTPKDEKFIRYSAQCGQVDFIAHSFIRNKEDILAVQKILDEEGASGIKIIAKIENREGVDNIEEILDYAYGVMVARGDLAVEIPAEQVPLAQRKLIAACRRRAKPVITATQMLHTMIENPRPTRAEVSDIANAILSGTDSLMLSGETAYGDYPIEAVTMMSKIAAEIEPQKERIDEHASFKKPRNQVASYLCKAAVHACEDLPIKAIVTHTDGGRTPRIVSTYREKVPIYAFASNPMVMRQLALTYGVEANLIDKKISTEELVKDTLTKLVAEGKLAEDDLIALLSGNLNSDNEENKHPGPVHLEIIKVKDAMK